MGENETKLNHYDATTQKSQPNTKFSFRLENGFQNWGFSIEQWLIRMDFESIAFPVDALLPLESAFEVVSWG